MSVTSAVKQHPVAIFLGGSVVLGWVVTILAAQFASNPALLPIIAIPISYVPAVLALIALRVAGSSDERSAFRRRLTTFRVGWAWYAAALLVGPLVHVSGVAIATLTGGSFPFHPAMAALLPLFLITNLGEEIGWRGYALPKLQERYGQLASALIIGVVWAAFHWLALLANPDSPFAYVAIGSAMLVALSVIMSFVFNNSRQSVPVVVLLHAMYDTVSIGVVPLGETGVPIMAFALTAVVAWVVAIATVAYGRQRATTGEMAATRAAQPAK